MTLNLSGLILLTAIVLALVGALFAYNDEFQRALYCVCAGVVATSVAHFTT